MSLIEVMIGGSILAGVGLAGAYIFKEQRKSQHRVEMDQELHFYHERLTRFLSKTSNCNVLFGSRYNNDIQAFNPTALYRCVSNCDASQANLAVPSPSSAFAAINTWLDAPKRHWMINSIEVPAATNTGKLAVKVTYQLNPSLPNARSVIKTIILNLRFSAPNQFTACYDPQGSSVTNLQADICKTMSVSSTGDVLATWDEATLSCKLESKICTAQGLGFAGIDSNGVVSCRSMTDGYDPTQMREDTAVACASPNRLSLSWNAVTKKLSTTCIPP
jgi:hypothetical protein